MHAGYDRPLAKSEFFIAVSAVYKMIGTLDDFGFIITGDKEFPVGIDRIVSDTFFLSHRFQNCPIRDFLFLWLVQSSGFQQYAILG